MRLFSTLLWEIVEAWKSYKTMAIKTINNNNHLQMGVCKLT